MKRRYVFVSARFMIQLTSSNIGMEPDYIFQGFSYFHQSVKKNNGISLQNGPLPPAFTAFSDGNSHHLTPYIIQSRQSAAE
jgi:hypothetical protein